MHLPQYRLDPGERRTIDIPIGRSGSGPADPVWFRWAGVRHLVSPADSSANPAWYPITFALGASAVGAQPEGAHLITGPTPARRVAGVGI